MSKRANEIPHIGDAASMDQVRDILFGAQLKDLEARFQRQEERFTREVSDAKDALKSRLDSLENFMKSESASFLSRLKEEGVERDSMMKSEQRERAEALAQISKELAGAVETFDRKLTKLSGTLDAVEQDLRRLLLTESTSLAGKIEEKYQEALNVISGTAAQIRHDMVYRSSLAGFLTEIAVKLSGQWTNEARPHSSEHETEGGGRKEKKTGENAGVADA